MPDKNLKSFVVTMVCYRNKFDEKCFCSKISIVTYRIYTSHSPRVLQNIEAFMLCHGWPKLWKYQIKVHSYKPVLIALSSGSGIMSTYWSILPHLYELVTITAQLSKQRLDQKSKDCGATTCIYMYTPRTTALSQKARWLAAKIYKPISHFQTEIIRISQSLSTNNSKESSQTAWHH